MGQISEIVSKWLSDVEIDVITNYNNKGHHTSGNFEKQLGTKVTEDKGIVIGTLFGAYYTYWLENGRKPTSPAKRGRLYGIMLEWVKQKGIASNLQEQKRIAYFVAKKIDEKGFAAKRIISDVITEQRLDLLRKQVADYYKVEIRKIWQ